jgi:plastocyanin
MFRVLSVCCVVLMLGTACSKSSNNATSKRSPSSSGSAASSSCGGLSGLSGITDKGTKAFSGNSVELEADNDNGKYYFEPSCAKANGTVDVTIKNVGDTEHNFSISSMGISKNIEKGGSVTVSVKLPASGTLPFFCKYHKSLGMQGAFIVG